MITHERLLELCAYDPETGLLTWRSSKGAAKGGRVVGGIANNGYWQVFIDGKRYIGHRVVWFYMHGSWPTGEIDHINGERADNRRSNLRDVTTAVNRQNVRKPKGKSPYLGVVYETRTGKWWACIQLDGKKYHLGTHATAEAASAAYLAAKRRMHEGCTI